MGWIDMERYKMINDAGVPDSLTIPVEHPKGEWVRFEDVKGIFDEQRKLHKVVKRMCDNLGIDTEE